MEDGAMYGTYLPSPSMPPSQHTDVPTTQKLQEPLCFQSFIWTLITCLIKSPATWLNAVSSPFPLTRDQRVRLKVLAFQDRDQDHPHGKEMQKSKMAVWGSLTNSCEKKRSESQGEKERYKHLNAEFQRIARRDRKPSSAINAKK